MGCAVAAQGVSRLSLVFQQFAVAALAVAVVHTLEAAARHPPITKVAASLFFAIAGAIPPLTPPLSSWRTNLYRLHD